MVSVGDLVVVDVQLSQLLRWLRQRLRCSNVIAAVIATVLVLVAVCVLASTVLTVVEVFSLVIALVQFLLLAAVNNG